jgi:hypothetical protein
MGRTVDPNGRPAFDYHACNLKKKKKKKLQQQLVALKKITTEASATASVTAEFSREWIISKHPLLPCLDLGPT